ncbi:ATP-binding protein [Candidatus Allofournierella excrementavium]|mgnify:FL=1|uniref:sensor histidine kinase n=1 Tax=Candidatus Allofournierella excrementavium TaxID=2838591 RepID=UPI003A895E71
MKLWQKIFLSTLALTVAVTSLLSLLFLLSSRSSLWERENQRALTQQQSLASLIKTGVVSQRLQSGKVRLSAEEADDAAASVLARQEADEYLVASRLLRRGTEDWNTIAGAIFDELMDAAALQGDDYADTALTYSRTFRQDGRLYLALNAPLSLEQTDYRLLCVFDVSEVEGILRRQAGTALALSATGSLAAAGALLVVVRGLLRPLNVLSRASRRIAAGSYSERIRLSGSDELADLAQDMNRMAEAVESRVTQLEQAAEDRSAFIANMAHEMKTPLTSILGFADLLYLQKDVTDKKRMEYAGIIVEETKRMRSLSGKLMELLNVGSQNLVFTSEPLADVMKEVAAAMEPVLASSGLTLQHVCEEGLFLMMDRELFKSLLYNFIDNGRKASPEGSRIQMLAHRQGGQAEIMIRDYGQGIPEKELEKVRQPFYMVDKSRSRKAGGAGLGLALCEEICRIHKGAFAIDSRVGKGTLITLRFPLAAPPVPGQEAKA